MKNKTQNILNRASYYKFALYIAVFLLINLVGVTLFFRIDLTKNGLYSLSDASIDTISKLEEPLTVNIFFTKNLPSPYNNVERYLHDLIAEYERYSKHHLSYRFYDVMAKEGDISKEAEKNRKIAQSYGIYPVNVQKIEQDEAKIQKAYMGMVLIHGDLVEKIPAITSTEDLEYKITTTIKKMYNKISALVKLKEKIKVLLINSSSLKNISKILKLKKYNTLENNIRAIVDKVNLKTYGQLKFIYVDPTKDPQNGYITKEYKKFGLKWPDIKTSDGTNVPAGEGILALGLEYSGKSFQKSLITKSLSLSDKGIGEVYSIIDNKAIESFISDNIENLININDDIGYLSSHGTLKIKNNLPPQMQMMNNQQEAPISNLYRLLQANYNVKEIDLKKDPIPDSIDTLIIAGPKESFSDYELFQIDQFLMKGKSVAFFMDSFREIRRNNRQQMFGYNQQPVYLPLKTGIEKLLKSYGITINSSYLMDESCYVNRDRNNNEMPIYFAPVIKDEYIDHSQDFMRGVKQLVVIKISPLQLLDTVIKKDNIKALKLFSSSDKAWEMKGRITLLPYMIKPPAAGKDERSYPLAYLLNGNFNSYFAGKDIPEKPVEKKKSDDKKENSKDKISMENSAKVTQKSEISSGKDIITRSKGSKIFVTASSELLKNNLIDEEGRSVNALFFLNLMDSLNNRENIAKLRGKKQRFNPLKESSSFVKSFVKMLNIAGLPALWILFGVFVLFRRKKRRKTIQAIFKKANREV